MSSNNLLSFPTKSLSIKCAMSNPEQYCMKWNNYQSHLGSFFVNLLQSEAFVDVTLFADGQKFKCHRVILSACSTYFQEILSDVNSKHPVILLPGMNPSDIKAIIEFIYHGELNNIDYDRLSSILKTADLLKIYGLMGVIDHLPAKADVEICSNEQDNCGTEVTSEISVIEIENSEQITENVIIESEDIKQEIDVELTNKRKDPQKKYSEESFSRALNDMMLGLSLDQAAKVHKIPRSTLYAKAKQHSGLNFISRKERSNQDCQAAIQAVAAGMSLQRASDKYGIPKTVLWRRVQKRLDIRSALKNRKKENKKCYPRDKIAPKKSSSNKEKQISTHSENKSAMVDCHSLSSPGGNKILKQVRLSQAVAACKEGKMSQSAASIAFQVPKTTIWRMLQKTSKSSNTLDPTSNEYFVKSQNYEVYCPSAPT